jgi:hypothetical protein
MADQSAARIRTRHYKTGIAKNKTTPIAGSLTIGLKDATPDNPTPQSSIVCAVCVCGTRLG